MNKKIGNLFKGDKVIWMVFFFLCMISIVEVFSASSNLTYKSQNYDAQYTMQVFQTDDAVPAGHHWHHLAMGTCWR